MNAALAAVLAVSTGVVVIAVAIAVVLLALIIALSLRGRQKRNATQSDHARRDLDEAHERAGRAERDREIAQEQTDHPSHDEP